jgi:hypothetical protein
VENISPQSRLTLLLGLEEGAQLVIVQMEAEGRSPKSIDDAIGSVGVLMVGGFKFSDLVDQVDVFYRDSLNARIPILEAYRHVIQKAKGAAPNKLADHAANLRRMYNQ